MRWLCPLFVAGCTVAPPTAPWWEQLQASGPCYEANLLDGLDTESTAELHAVFDCLNSERALVSLAPLDDALDGSSRDGVIGLVIADWIGDQPSFLPQLAGLGGTVKELLAEPEAWLPWLHMGLELVYGAPWPWLGASVDLASPERLEEGLISPILSVGGGVATVLLDDGLGPLAPLREALEGQATERLLWTLASVGDGTDPSLTELRERWAPDLADLLVRSRDSSNDRHSSAHGDSVRELVERLLLDTGWDGRPVLEHLGDPLLPVLADSGAQAQIEAWLREEYAAGRVQQLPAWLLYLASVDTDGGGLSTGEDSALVALIRLLHDADAPVDCSIDLVFTSLDFSFGNLSVSLLETLAGMDPATVDGGVDLLGTLLGFGLTDSILETVADSGVCPVIDEGLIADIHALDRFNDDGMSGALLDLIGLLRALDGHIPEVVELIAGAHSFDLVEPLEELLRDTADAALVNDVLGWLPVLLDPEDYHDLRDFPDDVAPIDFDAVWHIADAVLRPGEDGQTPLTVMAPVLHALTGPSQTWEAIGNLGRLLGEPEAELPAVVGRLRGLLERDPDLAWRSDAAALLDDPAALRLPLVLLEADDLRDALLETELAAPGPIPFFANLVVGGTLDTLLGVADVFLALLPEDS